MPGGSEHSFGIHVAQMAGMPQAVLQRAEEILSDLEEKRGNQEHIVISENTRKSSIQMQETPTNSHKELVDLLKSLDIQTMTPIDCMMKLIELKRSSNQYEELNTKAICYLITSFIVCAMSSEDKLIK